MTHDNKSPLQGGRTHARATPDTVPRAKMREGMRHRRQNKKGVRGREW